MVANQDYEQLIGRLVAWAETLPDIRAAVIIGSQARTNRPADEWSDLDLILLTTRPARYTDTSAWLHEIAPHWLTFVEGTINGERERRVLFEGGLDVDFIALPVEALSSPEALSADVLDIIRRGFRIILDKDGCLTRLATNLHAADLSISIALPLDETAFLNTVHDFWYHTVWSAKKLRRGELWTANGCLNGYMKWQCLLPMIRWHARALYGPEHDTWIRGRFLEQWADPRIVAVLPDTFGRAYGEDLWRALFETMNLFRWVAVETAEAFSFSYPAESEVCVTAWVNTCFEERTTT